MKVIKRFKIKLSNITPHLYRLFLVNLGLVLIVTSNVLAQSTVSPIQGHDSLIRYGKLTNGFTYYLRKTIDQPNYVEMSLANKVGFNVERKEQAGYAHLLEHLIVKRTSGFPDVMNQFRKPNAQVWAKTEKMGTFYIVKLNNKQSDIDQGFKLLQEWSQDLIYSKESLEVEKGAVLGEMRVNDLYRSWKTDQVKKFINESLNFHPFDKEQERANIIHFNEKEFKDFHQNWYKPNLQAAIIVGDIDLDEMERKIHNYFSGNRITETKALEYWNQVNAQNLLDKNNFQMENRIGKIIDTVSANQKVKIVFKQPDFSYQVESTVDMKNLLLQGLYWSMIMENKRILESNVDVPYSDLRFNILRNQVAKGQLSISEMTIDFQSDDENEMLSKIKTGLMVYKQLHQNLSTDRFEEAKIVFHGKYKRESLSGRSDFSEMFFDHFLDDKSGHLHPESFYPSLLEILDQISFKDFESFVKRVGTIQKNTDFLFFGNEQCKIPKDVTIKKLSKQVDVVPTKSFKSELKIASLEKYVDSIESTSDHIIKSGEKDIFGVYRTTLANGIKLVLKPSLPKAKSLQNNIRVFGFKKNSWDIKKHEDYLLSTAFLKLLNEVGAGPYSKFQIKQFKKDKKIQLYFDVNREMLSANGNCQKENLNELVNLIVLYFTKYNLDDNSIERWKNDKILDINGYGLRGSSHFVTEEVQKKWYPEIPVFDLKTLKKINITKLKPIANQVFSSFDDYTFIVTGDFEPKEILPTIINKLSQLPAKNNDHSNVIMKGTKDLEFPLHKMNEEILINNFSSAYVDLYFPITVPRSLKNRALAKILANALNKRIFKVLREGCYSPMGSGFWITNQDMFVFKVRFDSEIGNQNHMIDLARQEIIKLKNSGITKKELDAIITEEVMEYESGFKSFGYSDFWQKFLQSDHANNDIYKANILEVGTYMEHFVTLDAINSGAKQLFSLENYQQFVLLPNNL